MTTSKFAQSTRDIKGFYLNREREIVRFSDTSLIQLLQTRRLYLGSGGVVLLHATAAALLDLGMSKHFHQTQSS